MVFCGRLSGGDLILVTDAELQDHARKNAGGGDGRRGFFLAADWSCHASQVFRGAARSGEMGWLAAWGFVHSIRSHDPCRVGGGQDFAWEIRVSLWCVLDSIGTIFDRPATGARGGGRERFLNAGMNASR